MIKKVLKLQNYIRENGLESLIHNFKIKIKDYEKKVVLKYDQIDSPLGEDIVQVCRGLILEKDTLEVLSLAFCKFFNHGETYAAKIDWDSAIVLEKLDGTMCQIYWDWNENKWFVGTTGTAEGEGEVNNIYGTTFNALFWDTVNKKYNFDENNLNKDYIYVFELTTPYNIVVKPHNESSATLIAVRNRKTLEELPYDNLKQISNNIGVPLVKSYDLNKGNVEHILRTFENMAWYDEGYVVVDGNFNRIKIKNPAYVLIHHLKSKTAEHNIMSVVKSNEIEEFAATFPDRKDEIFKLKNSYDILISKLEEGWEELKTKRPNNSEVNNRKNYAMAVFEVTEKLGLKEFTGLYFALNDGKVDSVREFMIKYDNKRLYNML